MNNSQKGVDKNQPPECEVFMELLDLHKFEMQDAYANGVTANVNESFKAICKRLNINAECQPVFRKWLVEELNFDEAKIPDGYGNFVTTGLRLSNPHQVAMWNKYLQDSGVLGLSGEALTKKLCKQAEEKAMSFHKLAAGVDHRVKAFKTKVRAKDNIPGLPVAPKSVKAMQKSDRPEKWVASLAKELDALTEMGTVSHLHTQKECEELGVDFKETPPLSTIIVNEFKFATAEKTAESAQCKTRMVVDGGGMVKGVHFEESHSSTPSMETGCIMSILVVLLSLIRKSCDVCNAYANANQKKPMALRYPHGMPQFNELAELLYMLLWRNTYGKKDGGNLWENERNTFFLMEFNQCGWKCKQLKSEPCLFLITVAEVFCIVDIYTDDLDMAGNHDAMMDCIIETVNDKWKVRMTDAGYMLGVCRSLNENPDGSRYIEHTMTANIEGLVEAYREWLVAEGWCNGKFPDTPFPTASPMLSLWDPEGKVDPAEVERVKKRGFSSLYGNVCWPVRNCFPEGKPGVSFLGRVMSRPTEAAWKAAIHLLAWLDSQKHRGIRFSSDGNKVPAVTCDASDNRDPKDSKALYGYEIQWAGGPAVTCTQKYMRNHSTTGNEYLALYPCTTHIIWLRNVIIELGFAELFLNGPTMVGCDNAAAIDWVKFGKVTQANRGIMLKYREVDSWEAKGITKIYKKPGLDNKSDILSKAVTKDVIKRLLGWLCGYAKGPFVFDENTKEWGYKEVKE